MEKSSTNHNRSGNNSSGQRLNQRCAHFDVSELQKKWISKPVEVNNTNNMRSSVSSISTLSSLSVKRPNKIQKMFQPKSITFFPSTEEKKFSYPPANSPAAHIKVLSRLHRRVKRRKQWRKIRKIFAILFHYVIPAISLVLFSTMLIVWHFMEIEWMLSVGCIGLIVTIGCLIQMCFWSRAMPNKFNPSEVLFAVDNTISELPTKEDVQQLAGITSLSLPPKFSLRSYAGGSVASTTTNRNLMNIPEIELPPEETNNNQSRMSIVSSGIQQQQQQQQQQQMFLGMNPLQVRRISMALTKASQELSAARKMQTEGGAGSMINLARRLTMGGGTFVNVRGEENNWLGGRVARGVRRNLAWNQTGAGRFFANNYD